MTNTPNVSRSKDESVPPAAGLRPGSVDRDDLEIAKRRMKHLAPWNVAPMPMAQLASNAVESAPVSDETRMSRQRVAMRVMALQMAYVQRAGGLIR